MTAHNGSNNITDIYFGNTKISRVYYGSQLVFDSIRVLPTVNALPASYTQEQVTYCTSNNHQIVEITEDAFYRVVVAGSSGGNGQGANGGVGGKVDKIVWLYKGTKCLLWGASKGNNQSSTVGLTGYPSPTSNLGGQGNQGGGESGGRGGGAATNGGYVHTDGGSGGAGAGFLAGIDYRVSAVSRKESAWSKTINSTDNWSVGNFSVSNLYVYILAGGGGGGAGSNSSRGGGSGGGAWGNGGNGWGSGYTTGPGGTWGKGNNGSEYSAGATGAWAILDFSRTQFTWGTGGGASASNGSVYLYKLIPSA